MNVIIDEYLDVVIILFGTAKSGTFDIMDRSKYSTIYTIHQMSGWSWTNKSTLFNSGFILIRMWFH